MRPTRFFILRGVVPLVSVLSTVAQARARPHFEPTDLDLEATGVIEVDLQVGAVRGPGPWRAVLPDFEIDFGLLPYLELGLDGSYAIEGPATGPFSLDHASPDNLWPSVKLGLLDDRNEGSDRSWALGIAAGPKLPVASAAHGIGFESLLLLGHVVRRLHMVMNLGGFVEPAPDAISPRPIGLEAGLDVSVDVGDQDRMAVIGEISGARFWSSDPSQLLATGGCSWAVTPNLDVSLSALLGFLPGGDRYGLLLGVAPKMGLTRR